MCGILFQYEIALHFQELCVHRIIVHFAQSVGI